MRRRVGLLRHPAVLEGGGRCYGRTDLALRPGWEAALPEWLDGLRDLRPRRVRTSPLGRCRLPAAALADSLGVDLLLDNRLVELDFGSWERRLWEAVPLVALDRWAADPFGFTPPGGESGAALVERVRAVVAELVAEAGDGLVVSHGGPLRLLGPMLMGKDADLFAPVPEPGTMRTVELP